MTKKIDGLVVMGIAIFYAYLAINLPQGLALEEKVSPGTFPLVVAGMLFALGLIIVIQNSGADHSTIWPGKKIWTNIILFLILLFIYAFVFDYLGFLISTVTICTYIGVTLKGKFINSLISSIGICLFIQILFVFILEINLPLGTIIESFLQQN